MKLLNWTVPLFALLTVGCSEGAVVSGEGEIAQLEQGLAAPYLLFNGQDLEVDLLKGFRLKLWALALNIVLTPLLIHTAGLGIVGAALASNTSRAVATARLIHPLSVASHASSANPATAAMAAASFRAVQP